jgi:hypothetical protein
MHIVDRCFFVPFNRADAPDFVAEAAEATAKGESGDAHRARKFSVICADDGGTPLKKMGMGLSTRIEIVGHGKAGSPYVSNTGGNGIRKKYMPFSDICDLMIEMGLQKRYTGAISCGVCSSGISSGKNPSFADLVSRYLNHKGYLMLHTIGYMGAMNTVHERIGGKSKYEHRPVDVQTKNGTETMKTSDWAAWKHYSGIWSVPGHLKNLPVAWDSRPNV